MTPTITIFLTEEEAKRFVQFQKHYAIIGLLESVDAFKLINGSVTIHFDALGKIGAIEKHQDFRV